MMQITKGLAQKMYNEGEEIMIIPDHVKPNSPLAAWITKPENNPISFGQVCDTIHYYNCSPETGMKLAFYAKEVK